MSHRWMEQRRLDTLRGSRFMVEEQRAASIDTLLDVSSASQDTADERVSLTLRVVVEDEQTSAPQASAFIPR